MVHGIGLVQLPISMSLALVGFKVVISWRMDERFL